MALSARTSTVPSKYDRYNHSPKGYARFDRYRQSKAGKVRQERFYAKYGGKVAYERADYHKKQEEAGCYRNPKSFYPGFLLLQKLADAPVVEI